MMMWKELEKHDFLTIFFGFFGRKVFFKTGFTCLETFPQIFMILDFWVGKFFFFFHSFTFVQKEWYAGISEIHPIPASKLH